MDDIQPSLEKGPQVQFRPTGVVSHEKTAKEVDFSRTTTAGTAATRKPSGGTVVPVEFKSLAYAIAEFRQGGRNHGTGRRSTVIAEISGFDWHTLSVDEVFQRLGSDSTNGLTPDQVAINKKQFGNNAHSPPPSRILKKGLEYLFGGFGSVLIVAGILSCIAWNPLGASAGTDTSDHDVSNLALGIILFIVAALQLTFTAWQDWRSSRLVASLAHFLPPNVNVIRDGQLQAILAADLVPGDIVQLDEGAVVPADLRLFQVSPDLKFNKSVLTGDSNLFKSSVDRTSLDFLDTRNIALQGTLCTSGNGRGVVVLTGDSTVFGRIAQLTSERPKVARTLQKDILHLVMVILLAALMVTLLVIIVWATWLRHDHPHFLTTPGLIIAIVSVSVALIPEGLPVSIAIALTVVARRMKKTNILCKSLSTLEALGSINILCTDKTGTLTENRMTVINAAIFTQTQTVEQIRETLLNKNKQGRAWETLWTVAALSSTNLDRESRVHLPDLPPSDATDFATFNFARKLGDVKAVLNERKPALNIPFTPQNKFLARIYENTDDDPKPISTTSDTPARTYTLAVKGAPDLLFTRCTSVLLPSGEVRPMDEALLKDLREQILINWSRKGQRVLLLAWRVLLNPDVEEKYINAPDLSQEVLAELISDLILVGMIGIVDPPRPDIPEVIQTCRGAGIKVVMVTGDYGRTAEAVAREVGIITAPPGPLPSIQHLSRDGPSPTQASQENKLTIIIGGPQIPFLNEAQWDQICCYQEIVFARTTPEQKLRIIKELQARKFVVGMTGDGINDAPSLKAANIGIAMSSGSDIAMEAADIILLDSFSAIITAIEQGRLLADNLKKIIIYQLPAGVFSELWVVLLNLFLGLPIILSRFLMIVISMLTDCVAATILVFEKGEGNLLNSPPRQMKKDRIVDWRLLLHGFLVVGAIQCAASMAMAFWYLERKGIPFSILLYSFGTYPATYDMDYLNAQLKTASSIFFVNLGIIQLFNLLCVRTRTLSILQQEPFIRKRTRNLWLLPSMIFSLGVLFFFCYIPWFEKIIGTTRVPTEYWLLPISFGMGLLVLEELVALSKSLANCAEKVGLQKVSGFNCRKDGLVEIESNDTNSDKSKAFSGINF